MKINSVMTNWKWSILGLSLFLGACTPSTPTVTAGTGVVDPAKATASNAGTPAPSSTSSTPVEAANKASADDEAEKSDKQG